MNSPADRPALDAGALDTLFLAARTHRHWQDRPVPDALLSRAYELARMAPTSANCSPLRVVFVRTAEGKAKLEPCLSAGNVRQTMAAPVTAIFAHDRRFFELMPRLAPHSPDARSWFEGDPAAEFAHALRNGSLQAAYMILALRGLGLDCGPMGGFDAAKLDAAFFPDGRWASNFLCNIGYGLPERLHPRAPRLSADEACRFE
ncbi:MAG TPA: malonic semialdehyde reductase [Alphaproteobacteria bacterium]|nr:malonic semialdehyde reductase [Alphaproteobacteria bacterium]